jgi:L-lactate dehydrogenase complex protein LldG
MSSSREKILARLRQNKIPFPEVAPVENYRHMAQVSNTSPAALCNLFVEEATKLACEVQVVETAEDALKRIMQLIGNEVRISSWDPALIPLPGLAEALAEAGVTCVGEDAGVQIGLSGVNAALAATGSLVLCSGPGRFRGASLLPPTHIAFVAQEQIVSDLEAWFAQQRELGLDQLRRSSNVAIISGPSRTADIAMQPVMGMHGPGQVHIVLLADSGCSVQ